MHLRPRTSWLASAAAAALLLAACGDGSDEPVEDPVEEVDEPAEDDEPDEDEQDETGAASETDEESGEPDDADNDGEIAVDEVESILQGLDPQPIQVTYDLSGPDELGDGTATIAFDPPRTAQLIEAGAFTGHTIIDEDGMINCFQQDGAWQCMKMGGDLTEGFADEDVLDGVPTVDEDADIEDEDIQRAYWTTTLDRDALCLVYEEDGGETEACLDEESGFLLRIEVSGDEPFRMEATEIGDVEAAMFEPPAEPMDLGELPGMEDLDPEQLEDLEGLFDQG